MIANENIKWLMKQSENAKGQWPVIKKAMEKRAEQYKTHTLDNWFVWILTANNQALRFYMLEEEDRWAAYDAWLKKQDNFDDWEAFFKHWYETVYAE